MKIYLINLIALISNQISIWKLLKLMLGNSLGQLERTSAAKELACLTSVPLRIIRNFTVLIFTILFLIFNIGNASAQEVSVSIDPAIIQINAEAPAQVDAQISVQNLSDQTISYNIFLIPFKSSPANNGEIEFDETQLLRYKDFFDKVRVFDKENEIGIVRLAPNERKDLTLRVNLTEGEPPRDYYFSVLFISEAEAGNLQGTKALSRAGIGANILLSIGPKSETTGNILEFSSPRFITRGPVELILNLANTSGHFVTIEGNVVVKNMFGQTVGSLELLPVNILGNSSRFIESENNKAEDPRLYWDETFLLGFYRAELTVALSEEGPLLKKSITFFALPIEFFLGLTVAIILIIGIARRVKQRRDRGDLES